MEDDVPSKWQPAKAGVAKLTTEKTGFKPKKVTRDKDGHYITLIMSS